MLGAPSVHLPAAAFNSATAVSQNPDVDPIAAQGQEKRASRSGDADAPFTPTEEAIADVWAEVLGTPRVRRDDNFFEVGGDSLLLIRVLWRLQERIGPHVQMADLFQHRTLAALARRLDAPPGDEDWQAAVARAGTRRRMTMGTGAVRAAAFRPEPGSDE